MSKIVIKKSSVAGKVPLTTDLDYGELAINYTDEKIYFKNSNNQIKSITLGSNIYAKAQVAISKGDLVMFSGVQGDHILVTKADLNAWGFVDTWIVGVAAQDLAQNDFGNIVWFGNITGLDTSEWSEGSILYADPVNVGKLTATKPVYEPPTISPLTITTQPQATFTDLGSNEPANARWKFGNTINTPAVFSAQIAAGNVPLGARIFVKWVYDTAQVNGVWVSQEVDLGTVVGFYSQSSSDYAAAYVSNPSGVAWRPNDNGFFIPGNVSAFQVEYIRVEYETPSGHVIQIAAVTKQHANQGSILVRPTFGTHLDELHDTYIHNPTNGSRLTYNSTLRRWENSSDLVVSGTSTFTGEVLLNNGGGNEGGELHLAVPQTNTTLNGPIAIDVYGDRVRIFETSGSNRGAYLDLTLTQGGAGSQLRAYTRTEITANSATTNLDLGIYDDFVITLTTNTTFTLSNISKKLGGSGTIILKQDATGGRTFTKASQMKTPIGGAAIDQWTTANSLSVISYYVVDASTLIINYIGNFA